MIMHTESQIRALHSIEPNDRMLEVDATGNLISIPAYCRDYNQILNYVMLVKNINDLKEPGICLTEMASSRHDTYAISEFFNRFIYDYKMLHPCDESIKSIKSE